MDKTVNQLIHTLVCNLTGGQCNIWRLVPSRFCFILRGHWAKKIIITVLTHPYLHSSFSFPPASWSHWTAASRYSWCWLGSTLSPWLWKASSWRKSYASRRLSKQWGLIMESFGTPGSSTASSWWLSVRRCSPPSSWWENTASRRKREVTLIL